MATASASASPPNLGFLNPDRSVTSVEEDDESFDTRNNLRTQTFKRFNPAVGLTYHILFVASEQVSCGYFKGLGKAPDATFRSPKR